MFGLCAFLFGWILISLSICFGFYCFCLVVGFFLVGCGFDCCWLPFIWLFDLIWLIWFVLYCLCLVDLWLVLVFFAFGCAGFVVWLFYCCLCLFWWFCCCLFALLFGLLCDLVLGLLFCYVGFAVVVYLILAFYWWICVSFVVYLLFVCVLLLNGVVWFNVCCCLLVYLLFVLFVWIWFGWVAVQFAVCVDCCLSWFCLLSVGLLWRGIWCDLVDLWLFVFSWCTCRFA